MQRRISSFSVLRRSVGGWLAIVYGIILLLIGLYLAIGGVWLIALGGSWYYLFGGIGFIVAAAGF